ncbi:MAG: aromatic ring-hydroxylating dioxygenase subunit alpha [Cyanobacteria bacterium J06621_3]
MDFRDFWYVVALSEQLTDKKPIARTVLDEWLVIFRDAQGKPVALRDRCLHRNSRLSQGTLQDGNIQCPYHGWKYNAEGKVVEVPAEGAARGLATCSKKARQALRYATREQDGYVYVQLANNPEISPFLMIHYQEPGWETVRVINRFNNSVTNCAENFIDIPHTASVHPGIFRNAKQQQLQMSVSRSDGIVTATYRQETDNLGWFGWFLNPDKREIQHTDQFFMPNITRVKYNMGLRRQCFITSQSVPETENSTLVYTDVTFNYGFWNKLARPFVHWTAQKIISQDIVALKLQQETIEKYGEQFSHTPVDTIHVFVESIRQAIAQGKDPRTLPEKSADIIFWV